MFNWGRKQEEWQVCGERWALLWPGWLEMPQWLPGGMCCWQWTCMLPRWWAELKDGPVIFGPHSLSCSYLLSVCPYWKNRMWLSDQTPTYWFELMKIHLDSFKNNQNSWVILVFSVHAPSAHLATFCFTEHEHHYQQKHNWCKRSENTDQWHFPPVRSFSGGRRRHHGHRQCLFHFSTVSSSPTSGDTWFTKQ